MSVRIRRALYGKLAGDGTLTALLHSPPAGRSQSIYYGQAPSDALPPYVIFAKMAGTPTYSMKPGEDAFTSEVWLVKGVDRSDDTDPVENIQSRLKTLLTDATLSISGRGHMLLIPEEDVDYPEPNKGTTYRHSGAQFRLTHRPA